MNPFHAAFALLSYLVFLGSFLYAIGFVGDLIVPRSIDSPAGAAGWTAWCVDAALLGAFALQHSLMARPGFKRWWTRLVPPAIERSIYVLSSSLLLVLVFVAWRPLPGIVWDLRGTLAEGAMWVLFALGWLIVLLSTFMISHFELFGLTQAWRRARDPLPDEAGFTERFFYRFVRHPIMLGFLIAFWATPVMSRGHLLFSLLTSAYIVVGVKLEERDLVRKLGQAYGGYRERVPMFFPWPGRRQAPPARPAVPQG